MHAEVILPHLSHQGKNNCVDSWRLENLVTGFGVLRDSQGCATPEALARLPQVLVVDPVVAGGAAETTELPASAYHAAIASLTR